VCNAEEMTPSERSGPERPPHASAPDGPHRRLAGDLSVVAGSLHEQYDPRLGSAVVDCEVARVADSFADARVRSFVPLFVRRFAGAKLRDDCARQPGSATRPAMTASERTLTPTART
jgi:hypothetical protein